MDSQLVKITIHCKADGIIYILCICTVYGNHIKVTEVLTPVSVGLGKLSWNLFCLFSNFFGKTVFHPVCFKYSQNIDSGIPCMT